jgi:hypothetical protein
MSMMCRMLVLTLMMATPLVAQDKPASPEGTRTPTKKEAPAPNPQEAPAKVPDVGQTVNVRIELTITDQRGDTTPITKTVSMIASDRSWSRIRTQGDVRTPTGFRPVILNVDARPWLVRDNRARVELTIEYRPVAAEADTEKSTTPNINESLAVILEDGKPMLISQSADPVTDRKVKVEAKVSILK